MVPPGPAGVLICRFAPIVGEQGGRLVSSLDVGAKEAVGLASDLNSIGLYGTGPFNCGPGLSISISVLAFRYGSDPDIDIWVKRGGCTSVSNGFSSRQRLTPTVVAQFDRFLGHLDALSPQE